MRNLPYIILFFAAMVFSQFAWAQPPADDLPSESLTIENQFDAVLKEANKKPTSPTLPALDTSSVGNLSYSLLPRLLKLDYDTPPIRPLAMPRAPKEDSYQFYTKLGYGSIKQPYGELLFNNGSSEQFKFNGGFKHHSINADNQIENQRFANNRAFISGTYFFEEGYSAGADLGFQLDNYHFYGYNDEDTSIARDAVKQRFTTFDGVLNFQNTVPTAGDINYGGLVDFYFRGDKFQTSEFGVGGSLLFQKRFSDKHLLEIKLSDHIVSFDNTISRSDNLFEFEPNLTFLFGPARLKLGAYLGIDSEFEPYPDVELLVNLLEGKVQILAGWNGHIQQNSFKRFTDENPFLVSQPTLMNTRVQDRYAGLRGQFSKFSYEGRVSWKPTTNYPLYVNDYSGDSTRFQVIYDDIEIFTISGTVTVEPIPFLEVLAGINYVIYNTTVQEKAWFLPAVTLNAGAVYTYKEKLRVNFDAFIASQQRFLRNDGVADFLNSRLDINLGAHYQVQENFGVFINANNLINNKFQGFNNYPNIGFNILGGVTIKL